MVSGWVSICSPNRSTRELPSPPATARLTRSAGARASTANSAAIIEVCGGAAASSRCIGAGSRRITRVVMRDPAGLQLDDLHKRHRHPVGVLTAAA